MWAENCLQWWHHFHPSVPSGCFGPSLTCVWPLPYLHPSPGTASAKEMWCPSRHPVEGRGGKGCSERSDTRVKPFTLMKPGILGQETGGSVQWLIVVEASEACASLVVFEFSPQAAELNSLPDRMQHIFFFGAYPSSRLYCRLSHSAYRPAISSFVCTPSHIPTTCIKELYRLFRPETYYRKTEIIVFWTPIIQVPYQWHCYIFPNCQNCSED